MRSRSRKGFTILEMMVVGVILLVVFMVVNTLYVSSAKQSRASDEHATAASLATYALEHILSDLRQMAVRPKNEPLSECYQLSNDRKSIAFLRADPGEAAPGEEPPMSVVTYQLDVSPEGTGNYVVKRVVEREGGGREEEILKGIVLRDVSYEPLERDGRDFVRVSLTALSRDGDLRTTKAEHAPRQYSASSLFEVQRPAPAAEFLRNVPVDNVFAAITPSPLPAPPAAPSTVTTDRPMEQPVDVPPPPVISTEETPSTTTPAGPPSTTPAGPPAVSPPGDPPAPPEAPPQPAQNPFVARNVRPALRDPIQRLLDTIRQDYGDDFRGKVRGNVWGRFEVTNRDGTRNSGSFDEAYSIDFSTGASLDPARQIERIIERMSAVASGALEQFFRQHGVAIDQDLAASIRNALGRSRG